MKLLKTYITLSLFPVLFAGCAIQQNVQAVNASKIEHVCIRHEPATHMDAYEPMLQKLIEQRGIKTEIYKGPLPPHCQRHLNYTATWRWDGAMYLRYTKISVFDGTTPLGNAEYKAGIMSLAKFGRTESKVAPLITQLFP